MAEYIEREALNCMLSELEKLAAKRAYDTPTSSPAYMRYVTQSQERKNLKDKISELPAADVAPVVHGRWIEHRPYKNSDYQKDWVCSNCGRNNITGHDRYCSSCGAKMQEVR